MGRYKLGIKQAKPRVAQPMHQIGQRNLGPVLLMGKHAFPEKCTAQRYAVNSPNQIAVAPNL